MGFKTGLEAAAKAADESNKSFGPKLAYRRMGDGEKLILRFLTDEIIPANFYDYVLTKQVKKYGDNAGELMTQDFMVDPDGTDWVRKFGAYQQEFGTGKLLVPKARKQTVGIAVVREEVQAKGGRGKTEIVDKEVIVDHDGKKFKGREFVLIKQGYNNFWSKFKGMANRYGTICDRDYEVTRVGDDKSTDYEIGPIDPIEALRDIEDLHKFYGYGRKLSEDDPDRFLYCPQTLAEWAEYYSGEDRAREWLVGDEAPAGTQVIDQDGNGIGEFDADTTSNPDEAQSGSPKFGDFKDLLKQTT